MVFGFQPNTVFHKSKHIQMRFVMCSSHSIFQKDNFVKFKKIIKQYCDEQNYHDLNLSDDEYVQLSWIMFDKDSTTVTPIAKGQDIIDIDKGKLHLEIKRVLARRYCFE